MDSTQENGPAYYAKPIATSWQFLRDGSLKKLVEPAGRLWFYDGGETLAFKYHFQRHFLIKPIR
jgi:hypothetical protein